MKCPKCGSTVFLVDETVTHVEVNDEIVKTYTGEFTNRNCVRCVYPELYADLAQYDE